jgi:hypothetical protein
MIYLRQSTASQEVILGPFVDSTDGNTQKTALTIANTDIKIWVSGATTLANKNSGGATHIAGGVYYAVLDATDTATIGPLVIFVHVATALAVKVPCVVLDEAVYDVMFGTVALATATNITAGTITTVTTLTNDPTGVGTLLTRMGTPANLGSGATVAANLSDIEAQTDDIGVAGAGLTALPWNPAWDAEVESEANDALVAQNLDHLMKIAVDTDFSTTVHLNSVIGYLADDGTAPTYDRTTDSLEAIAASGGGGGLDAAGVRAAIGLASANLDTQLADLPTNAELAAALATADDATLAAIAALNDLSAAEVRAALGLGSANLDTQLADLPTNAELTTALADLPTNAELTTALADLPTNAELSTALGTADDATLAAIAALNNLSAAQVNAEVVDALTVDVIADSTPAHESRPTIAQGVLLATRLLTEKEVAGTTVTVNKEDGTTAAATFTLDDATNPTSITRTT